MESHPGGDAVGELGMEEIVPPEEEEKGPYEARIAAEVESAYEEFQKKEEAGKAKKAAERETARQERKEDLKAFLKRKKNKK